MENVAAAGGSLAVSPIYIGLGALMFVLLSARVILGRREHKVGIGTGGNDQLTQRIRAQGNCAEYLPMILVMLVAIELSGAPAWVVHLYGAVGVISRAIHASGLSRTGGVSAGRSIGMVGTFAVLIFGAVGLLGHALL